MYIYLSRIVLISMLLPLNPAITSAKQINWQAQKTDTGATLADCTECDENMSMLITCENHSNQREVNFLVLEQREDKFAQQATIVKMTTDGKVLTVNATYSTPGEAGPYPIAKLSANDPFFETLAHAETATFQVGGSEIVFKLMGSMQGLKKFDELCH